MKKLNTIENSIRSHPSSKSVGSKALVECGCRCTHYTSANPDPKIFIDSIDLIWIFFLASSQIANCDARDFPWQRTKDQQV